jgi:hypothetical protein
MLGRRRGWFIAAIVLCLGAGCGGGGGAPAVDAAGEQVTTGMCSADVPPGQACNMLTDVGTPVMPTCATATMPTGTGGPVADGTYVLTAQTYYNVVFCPPLGFSETIQVAGDCMQVASNAFGAAAVKLTVAGPSLTSVKTCVQSRSDAGLSMAGPSTQTFTATATTLTLFTDYTSAAEPGIDNVAVFTKL